MASAAARLLLLIAVAGVLLRPAAAEIKQEFFKEDSRQSILFEKFGFSVRGSVSITLTGAKAASSLAKPDPTQLGFFLLSDEALFEAIYEQPPPTDLNPNPDPNTNCVLSSPYVTPLFTFADLDAAGNYSRTFPVTHPDEYSLFFANCAPETAVTMEVRTDMYNTNPDGTKDYLSVGEAPVPTIYAFFALGYVAFLAGWLYLTLYHSRLSAHRIHHLMSCLLLARMLYCISAAEDQHYIRVAGSSHGWDVMFYLFQLVKGVILFAVIALIGTGWSFLKPFLQDKEKKVLMVVIPLQVAANIAAAVVGETGPFLQEWVTWNQIFLFVDVACCCAVLFPVVWSMRSLRESSKTDGKAARTLAKLTLFRQFYVVVIGYLYFTRIIVYALKTITNYKYRWVSVAVLTVAILCLSTGYFGGIGAPFAPYFWPYLDQLPRKKEQQRPVRVYMDGCFDLMHYGHANALRQAKLLGDQLVVGVVSDEEIVANKGPPVLSMEERLTLVSGLKWVDEVIPNAPYEITEEFMNTLFNKYNIDYIIHGDDPCLLPDGTDAYALAKKAGRYKQIKRTEGVSSTDIVGRILLTFKHKDGVTESAGAESRDQMKSQLSNFLPTSRRIMQFSNGQAPSPGARVVYIDGTFDLFHAGHVEILRSARQLGDFLLVGVHDDQAIRERRGSRPIMHLHERTLSVLACRYVDEVIIGAPREVSRDMITTFNISLVVHGTVAEGSSAVEVDPYALPKSMGIFQTVTSPKTITSVSVARRIIDNHEAYKKRNLKKKASEDKYYTQKEYVSGD